jgi:hypothetical protein
MNENNIWPSAYDKTGVITMMIFGVQKTSILMAYGSRQTTTVGSGGHTRK